MCENVAWVFPGERTVLEVSSSMVLSPAGQKGPPGHCWRALASSLKTSELKTGLGKDRESLLMKIAGREEEDQVDII